MCFGYRAHRLWLPSKPLACSAACSALSAGGGAPFQCVRGCGGPAAAGFATPTALLPGAAAAKCARSAGAGGTSTGPVPGRKPAGSAAGAGGGTGVLCCAAMRTRASWLGTLRWRAAEGAERRRSIPPCTVSRSRTGRSRRRRSAAASTSLQALRRRDGASKVYVPR